MSKDAYTDDQIKDIQSREAKGLATLKELELTPAAIVTKQNIGNDVFVDKVQPFLQDTKYVEKAPQEGVVSPIQKEDIKNEDSEETV